MTGEIMIMHCTLASWRMHTGAALPSNAPLIHVGVQLETSTRGAQPLWPSLRPLRQHKGSGTSCATPPPAASNPPASCGVLLFARLAAVVVARKQPRCGGLRRVGHVAAFRRAHPHFAPHLAVCCAALVAQRSSCTQQAREGDLQRGRKTPRSPSSTEKRRLRATFICELAVCQRLLTAAASTEQTTGKPQTSGLQTLAALARGPGEPQSAHLLKCWHGLVASAGSCSMLSGSSVHRYLCRPSHSQQLLPTRLPAC